LRSQKKKTRSEDPGVVKKVPRRTERVGILKKLEYQYACVGMLRSCAGNRPPSARKEVVLDKSPEAKWVRGT